MELEVPDSKHPGFIAKQSFFSIMGYLVYQQTAIHVMVYTKKREHVHFREADMQDIIGEKMQRIGAVMSDHGWNFIIGLVLLIAGLMLARQLVKWLKQLLVKTGLKPALAGTICGVCNVLLYVVIVIMAASIVGFDSANLFN
jgi:hypothetical protein